ILHNELYVGRMVWNRQRFLKDPDTDKRVARPNPQSAWIVKEVPELRIIDDETWKAVRDRYASVQRKWSAAAKEDRFRQFRRPKYLFSGITKCGECGAGFIVHSREFLGCFGARDRGTCTNRLRISGLEVKGRMEKLQERKEALEKQMATADEPPPLLHSSMADLYRTKVEQLAAALQREDTCLEASEMLRGFIDSIVLTPEKGQLRIE